MIKTYPKHTIQPIFSYQNLIKSFISSKGVSDLNLYHSGSAALFSGLQTLIAQKNIKNIFIPKFICKEVVEVVKKCNINIDYYDVDLDLNIDSNNNFKKNMSVNSVILIVNYFGFSTNWNLIQHLKETYGCLVVEDNCHILDSNRKADILSKSADLITRTPSVKTTSISSLLNPAKASSITCLKSSVFLILYGGNPPVS